jgi:hypothetical protein
MEIFLKHISDISHRQHVSCISVSLLLCTAVLELISLTLAVSAGVSNKVETVSLLCSKVFHIIWFIILS